MKFIAAALLLFSSLAAAQQATTAAEAPPTDTSYIDSSGAAHITRVMPVPRDISPEAQKVLAQPVSDAPDNRSLAERRHDTDLSQARDAAIALRLFPVHLERSMIAGVPVRIVTPAAAMVPNRVLLNIHGGGFNTDSGSLIETIPIANLTRMKVVAVLYRLAPEHPFPAGIDDCLAVYREMLKTYSPAHIAIYGTSAGATMTAELAVKIKQLGLPLPAALGVFSGLGDFTHQLDSWNMYTLDGLSGHHAYPEIGPHDPWYVGSNDPRNPILSPAFADLHGMPPTLFISSERDALLSGTILLHLAFLRAGDESARLVVFNGLPHAFWGDPILPESKEADGIMAHFFTTSLNP